MKRLLLLILMAAAIPALAGTYAPLQPGAMWTLVGTPSTGTLRFAMGAPAVWHGATCQPRGESINGRLLGTTHWSEDAAGRALLHGLEYADDDHGIWYFVPPAVYLDPSLQPGETVVSTVNVYEVTDIGDQWYGERTVTLTCVDRDPVETPLGMFSAIAVDVTWDDASTGPWRYGEDSIQSYGFGVGPVRIHDPGNPLHDWRLSEVAGLNPLDAVPAATDIELIAAPNPFNPATELSFRLDVAGRVRLTIHDLAGRRVDTLLDRVVPAGPHRVPWRPQRVGSGVYLARLTTDDGATIAHLTVIR